MHGKAYGQLRLFLVYLRDMGRCWVCGREVAPDDAVVDEPEEASHEPQVDPRPFQLAHTWCNSLHQTHLLEPEAVRSASA